jgi:glycogen synthase
MRVHRRSSEEWKTLQRNGMNSDFSWDHAALEYLPVYEAALGIQTGRTDP